MRSLTKFCFAFVFGKVFTKKNQHVQFFINKLKEKRRKEKEDELVNLERAQKTLKFG